METREKLPADGGTILAMHSARVRKNGYGVGQLPGVIPVYCELDPSLLKIVGLTRGKSRLYDEANP